MFVPSPVPRSRSLSSLGDVPDGLTDGKTASFRLDAPSNEDQQGGEQQQGSKEERQKRKDADEEAVVVERMNRKYHKEMKKMEKTSRTANVTYNRGSKPRKRPTPKKKSPLPKDGMDVISGLRCGSMEVALSSQADLLTTFQTYSDTCTSVSNQPPPPPQNRQRSPATYRRLSQEKPTKPAVVLSPNLTRGFLLPQQNANGANLVRERQSREDSGLLRRLRGGVQSQECHYKEEHTPESLRHLDVGLPKSPNRVPSPSLNRGGCLSQRRGLRIVPALSTLLRVLTIIFSILASNARLASNFSSARSLSLWLESPILQLVRVNLAVLQNVFITIELDFGIPVLLPRKTLDSCKFP